MDERVNVEFLENRLAQLRQEEISDMSSHRLKSEVGRNKVVEMELADYRLDQAEKRAEAADARMARVESQLTQIQISLAGLATKDSIRNWGIGVIAIVIATGIGVGAMMMQSSSNQLSAFQAGLSAVQAVAAEPAKK